MLSFFLLPFSHEMVHFLLYLSDLEMELTFLLFVAFNEFSPHRLKLLLDPSQLFG